MLHARFGQQVREEQLPVSPPGVIWGCKGQCVSLVGEQRGFRVVCLVDEKRLTGRYKGLLLFDLLSIRPDEFAERLDNVSSLFSWEVTLCTENVIPHFHSCFQGREICLSPPGEKKLNVLFSHLGF